MDDGRVRLIFIAVCIFMNIPHFWRRRCLAALAMHVWLLTSLTATGLAKESLLVSDGKVLAEIVITKDPPRTVRLAAEELQTYVRKMTGAELPIVEAPSDAEGIKKIFVGRSHWTDQLGVSSEGLNNGAFRIVSGPDWLILIGADKDFQPKEPWARRNDDIPRLLEEWDEITGEHFGNIFALMYRKFDPVSGMWEFDLDNAGSFNAVNQFLRDQGVRWYMPGELGEVVPQKKSIALPKIDKTYAPDFPLRQLYQHGGNFWTGKMDEILWQLRLGTNQGNDLVGFGPNPGVAHGIRLVISRDEAKAAHPEYYQLQGGQRQTDSGVPSLVSEGLIQANVRYLRKVFDTYDVPMVSVMPTDGFTAICEEAAAQGKENPERGRLGSLSDYVWEYVAKVATELAKTHPDKMIHCLAYTTYLLPPEKIEKLPPNVVVGIAQNRSSFAKEETKELFHGIREGWLEKITSGVLPYQYEYYLQDHPSRPWKDLPVVYPRLIVEDLQYLNDKSIGDYAEVYRGGINPVNLLNVYVTSRFYWDVNQDLESMLDEYYRLFYGPAEQPMREFFTLAEEKWRDFSGDDAKWLLELLDTAEQAAGDTVYGKRVALIRENNQMGLERVAVLKQSPELIRIGYLDESGTVPMATVDSLPSFNLKDGVNGQDLTENTGEVSIGWTGDDLFFRVVCNETDMSSLRKFADQKDDTAIFRDDTVEILIGTPSKGLFAISINPAGTVVDLDATEQGFSGIAWDSQAEVKTLEEPGRWVAEVSIPIASLNAEPPTLEAPWKVNVGRNRPRGTDRSYSSLAPTGKRTLLAPERMMQAYYEDSK